MSARGAQIYRPQANAGLGRNAGGDGGGWNGSERRATPVAARFHRFILLARCAAAQTSFANSMMD